MSDLLRDEPLTPSIVASDVVFEGRVWNVVRERFAYNSHELVREFVQHPGAVAVLAMDAESRVLLIQQYRHPIRLREWELPAGLLDVHLEEPLAAAKRELAEEADLAANDWVELAAFHPSPGGNDELIRIYLATGLSDADAFTRTDEEADIVKRWVSLDEAVAGVLEGRLQNSILMIAVLAAHARR